MIFPNALNEGDTIKIISPSNGVKEKDINYLDGAIKYLNSKGFNTLEDKYVRQSINGMSSLAKNRAKELNKAFNDPKCNALIACSGGDFLIQVFEYLRLNNIKKNIKWIQGQSDITNLLYYISTNYDIATLYSFNVKTFGKESIIPIEMLENNIKLLKKQEIIQYDYKQKICDGHFASKWECITNFTHVKGRIIGGCLDSLKDLIGTKYDKTKKFINRYKSDGIIWYFDVAEMTNEDILRTMWQLKNAGWFINTKCILFGRLYEEKTYNNLSLKNAILNQLELLNIPILINIDIGHTYPNICIVNGSIVEINYDNKKDSYFIKNYFIE